MADQHAIAKNPQRQILAVPTATGTRPDQRGMIRF